MIETIVYKNLKEALGQVITEDKNYELIKHNFPAGDVVKDHFHPNVGEWIIFDSGKFEVALDFERKTIDNPSSTSAIHFPKGYIHGLKCMTEISYLVLREGQDEIIYLKDVLKKKSSIEPVKDPCGLLWELYNQGNLSIAYVKVTGTAKKHKHEIMQEKYFVEKGEGELVINDEILKIKKDDIISIPKNSWHYLRKIEGQALEVLVITHPKFNPNDFILE